MKLYTYPNNPRAAKALIAAQYVGAKIEQPSFTFGVDNKTPAFLAKNPLGKVPVLETAEGSVFESNAIARYVARQGKNNLFGSSAIEAAHVEQWIDFSVGEIDLPAAAWLFPIKGYVTNNEAATKKAKGDIRAVLAVLDGVLADKTFLVGERVSLADIVVVCSLVQLYVHVLDTGFRSQFVNANRWFSTCVNQPQFAAVLGNVTLCTKMAVAPKAPVAAKPDAAAEKKAAADKKAEAKKSAKKADDEAAEAKPAKKAANPLDLLPPSPLVLDEWKRVYSNEDTRSKAVPWFWENFDREGYSLWWCDYNYDEDQTVLFKSLNLLNGWIQRLDQIRKHAFGTLLVFKVNKDGKEYFAIKGVWLFRGQEIPFYMKDSPDFESYTFRKFDLDSEAEKKKHDDFLCWEAKVSGLEDIECVDGKTFK